MKVLAIFACSLLVVAECSLLQTYNLPSIPSITPGITPGINGQGCGAGEVLHNGRCITPVVNTHSYIYSIPDSAISTSAPRLPAPQVVRNIMFVRLPDDLSSQQSIVVPPPEHKNIVYVLQKKDKDGSGPTIHVPTPQQSNPEIHFVSYGDGENPTLPTGQDLQTALGRVTHIHGNVVNTATAATSVPGVTNGNGYEVQPPPNPSPPGLYSTPQ